MFLYWLFILIIRFYTAINTLTTSLVVHASRDTWGFYDGVEIFFESLSVCELSQQEYIVFPLKRPQQPVSGAMLWYEFNLICPQERHQLGSIQRKASVLSSACRSRQHFLRSNRILRLAKFQDIIREFVTCFNY